MAWFKTQIPIKWRVIECIRFAKLAVCLKQFVFLLCLPLVLSFGPVAPVGAHHLSEPQISGSVVQSSQSDQQRYLMTVCDHLRRTLRGKTPVVLYIDGKVHLVGDVHPRTVDTCVGVIFSTTPGKGLKTLQLLS